jgi:pimeloyl-ACP methyl ester carboxylesterase
VAAVAAVASLAALSPALAQHDSARVTLRGSGNVTYVLLPGLVGGPPGYHRLESRLLRQGHRVMVVDPYRLSVDSVDVTFEALARRVEREMATRRIDSARVVGHAHGAGVALRLAARSSRVTSLHLLDAGAIPSNRTRVFSSALRLVPLITRIPGGRALVRRHLLRGLRQHSATTAWLDAETQRAYTEPVLDNISSVITMAWRLADAEEPESVAAVVRRVRIPVMVILAGHPHPAAPDSSQIAALNPLGARLRVVRLDGVGHFPHEERPDLVFEIVTSLGGSSRDPPPPE